MSVGLLYIESFCLWAFFFFFLLFESKESGKLGKQKKQRKSFVESVKIITFYEIYIYIYLFLLLLAAASIKQPTLHIFSSYHTDLSTQFIRCIACISFCIYSS